jgi:hypothetical protein
MGWMEAAQIGAQIFDKGLDQYNANRAFSKNKWLAREQMRFQERMASTQYQRAARDLEAAGLNRVLALGSPAAAPQGSTATYKQTQTPKLDLMAIASAKEAIEGQRQQNRILKAQADKEEVTKKPYEMMNEYLDDFENAVKSGISNASDLVKSIQSFPDKVTGAFSAAGSSAKELYDDTVKMAKDLVKPKSKQEQRSSIQQRSRKKIQTKRLNDYEKRKFKERQERRAKRNKARSR